MIQAENSYEKSNVGIAGPGADNTMIRGLGRTHVLDGVNITNVTISGLTITGSGDTASGIYLDQCSNIIIRDNVIRDNGNSTTSNAISISGTSEVLIERNILTRSGEGGIYLSGDAAAIIRNNIISNNVDSGIYRGYGNRISYIVNNVIDSNGNGDSGRSGIMVASNDIIANNIITLNGTDNPNPGLAVGIYVINEAKPLLSYNNLWGNYQGSYTNVSAGTGDISEDPQYENSMSGKYNLGSGSSSIDAGDPDLRDSDCSRSDMGVYGGPFAK